MCRLGVESGVQPVAALKGEWSRGAVKEVKYSWRGESQQADRSAADIYTRRREREHLVEETDCIPAQ